MVSYSARARGSFCRHYKFGRRCHVFTGGTHQPVCTSTYAAHFVIEIDSTFLKCHSPLGSLRLVLPKLIKCWKTCGSRLRRIEWNGAVSHNIEAVVLLSCIPRSILTNLFALLRSRKNRHLIRYFGRWRDYHFLDFILEGSQGLQEFATSSAHLVGQNAYRKNKFPYMGIMHETYYSPKGSWETIYDNVPPLGFGKWTFQMSHH